MHPKHTKVILNSDNDIFANLKLGYHFHGQDNQVLYYTLISSGKNKPPRFIFIILFIYYQSGINWFYDCRFTMTDPTIFRTGDIVEVQSTISIVPVKKDRYRMVINLRALAMLDSGPSMVSRAFKQRKYRINPQINPQKADCQWSKAFITQAPSIKASIKHKVGYTDFDDEVTDTRHKISNMGMNGGD